MVHLGKEFTHRVFVGTAQIISVAEHIVANVSHSANRSVTTTSSSRPPFKHCSPTRNQLNALVQRRHRIVHEGDLIRHQRGGQTRAQSITRKYVADSLDFLDTLVGHLENV